MTRKIGHLINEFVALNYVTWPIRILGFFEAYTFKKKQKKKKQKKKKNNKKTPRLIEFELRRKQGMIRNLSMNERPIFLVINSQVFLVIQ